METVCDVTNFIPSQSIEIRIIGLANISISNSNLNCYQMGKLISSNILSCLELGSVTLKTNKDIFLEAPLEWSTNYNLSLISQGNIIFGPNSRVITHNANVIINLKSGMENSEGSGKVIFEGNDNQIQLLSGGSVQIYYNPEQKDKEHKYQNPYGYFKHVSPMSVVKEYMLVNDVQDLQNIHFFLAGSYALSKNINAIETREWNSGKGFDPIYGKERSISFGGRFDGNGYSISNLYINREIEDNVGLFRDILGTEIVHTEIRNLELENAYVRGDHRVGVLSGNAVYVDISSVSLNNAEATGRAVVGGLVGTLCYSHLDSGKIFTNVSVEATESKGTLIGAVIDSTLHGMEITDVSDLIGYVQT